ncbi:MAG: cytochrome c [Acidobacteria bacterium]|uniref:Cytochrome c n=1 Tax=Candidatus Polarisedimenticola svalbardensis TaxID=2886004 RepID=A0A8J6Y3X9_9BACT|nr:cytochrome c [Candidatus Polarisedimenticola svalbardensis]
MILARTIGGVVLLAGLLSGCTSGSPEEVGAGDPDWHEENPAAAIRGGILSGKGEMPSFEGKLTEEELRKIVGYVQRRPELKSNK